MVDKHDSVGADVMAAESTSISVADLATYCMMLGDDALIMAHRTSQWCSRAPELEEDVALGAIALDLLGQARRLLSRAGELEGAGRGEDRLAYFRDEHEFRNVRLVEIDCGPDHGGDFATSMARLLVFAVWRLALFERLVNSTDATLAAIARSGVPELARQREHATRWMIRISDHSTESQGRLASALRRIWPLIGELFVAHPVESRLAETGIAVDPASLLHPVESALSEVLSVAGLDKSSSGLIADRAPQGRDGVHTDALGYLLAEMQQIARSDPHATW